MIFFVLIGAILAYVLWTLVALEINYRRASTMGIPLVRLPIDHMNLAWLVLAPMIWPLLDALPINWGNFGRYCRREWNWFDKAESHLQYGPIWAHVTAKYIYVYVADPDAIHSIFTRRNDFLRPSHVYKLLEIYGPCISTASNTDWPRHRKVLAAPFNESIMKFVWTESIQQARQMQQVWISRNDGISSVAKDTRTLSLNVLAATGFRKSHKFHSSDQKADNLNERSDGIAARSYRDALATVLDNSIFLMITPRVLLSSPVLPKSWARIKKAADEFKGYMNVMLDEETKQFNQGQKGTGGLMTSFVQALNTNQKEEASKSNRKVGLSVEEIFGNIFVINFAGHDTTANTLAFTMLLLAAYPEIQEWVAEEVKEFARNLESCDWEYSILFPLLKRCQAVLLETLRLFPPIMSLPKWTNSQPQELKVGNKTIMIPPNTGVMPSLLSVQTLPQYWEDPLKWNPHRWISSTGHEETIITPQQSTFFPWSDGPQNCPGEKFARVEFVAILACLLRHHRIKVVRKPDETLKQAQKRVLDTTEDCNMEMLLRMQDPDRVRLSCVPAQVE